jgi:hypothetical protein
MSSNFNNAKIINVYYNKGDRKPYDVNGKPIAYIGEEAIGATEATTIRFYLGEDLDSSTAVIVTKRPDGERRLDLCEKFGTGVNSYYQVTLNAWYGAVKGKATLAFKVYNGSVVFDDNETPTEIISVEGRIVVSDIFNLEIAYAPEADLIVPADDTPDYVEWFAALSTKLDKAQSITVTGALPTLTGGVYDDRYFYVENEGVGRLYYINGSTAIEVVWQVGTLRLTPTGNGNNTADTGKLSWNQPNGTVNVGLYNDVNIGVGEDVIYYVKASGAITKGDVIQYAGYQGDHALAKRAVQSEINANPKLIMGIAKQNIANGDFGYVAHFGKLEGVDTKGFGVDSFVWFDSAGSTAGNWTTIQPTAPNAKILLAVIIKAESSAEANNGVLLVRPTIEPSVKELQDVLITSIANEQVLRWNATNSRWENTGALTTAESNITNLQGRMTTEEANVDNLQGRMTSAEGDIDDIESGATIVPRALGDQNGNTINTTYLTQSSASATYIPLSQKAQANGVATLGADGRVVASQIPSVVTSLEEYDSLEDFPETGFLTVVYLAMDTGLTYLWSGTQYVIISSSLALGESSTTAYRGDRGKVAYDYSQVGHLPLAGGTVTGNLVVGGDLTISGTTTTINTETIGIKDNIILINSNQTGTPSTALKGGLEIERGDLTNFQFVFDENDDRFKVGQVGSLQTVATRTDDGTIANRGITFFNTSTNRLENNANIVIDSDNKVGIGIATPTSLLEVSTGDIKLSTSAGTNANLRSLIFKNTNSTGFDVANIRSLTGDNIFEGVLAFDTKNSGGTMVERMRILSNGNVGIGTSSPEQQLEIKSITTSGTTSGTLQLSSSWAFPNQVDGSPLGIINFKSNYGGNASGVWGKIEVGADGTFSGSNSLRPTRMTFSTTASGTGGVLTERMRILSNGNVGIGTASPNGKITVQQGTSQFSGLFGADVNDGGLTNSARKLARIGMPHFTNAEEPVSLLVGDSDGTNNNVYIGGGTGAGNSATKINFYTASNINTTTGTIRMVVDSGGNVGIGTTSPTTAKLEVANSSNTETSIRIFTSGVHSTYIGNKASDTNLYISNTTSGGSLGDATKSITLQSDGKVGIGTNNPATLLQVRKDQQSDTAIMVSNSGTASANTTLSFVLAEGTSPQGWFRRYRDGSALTEIGFNNNLAFTSGIDATKNIRMWIDSGGNVSIGTTSLNGKLNVFGTGSTGGAALSINPNSSTFAALDIVVGANNTSQNGLYVYSTSNNQFNAFIRSNGNLENRNNSYGGISDIKLKENITDAKPKLNDLNKVRIVNFNFKNEETKQLGVIAQELEKIFPGMVEETEDKDRQGKLLGTTTKSVKYSVFVPMLIKAVQELKEQLDELKAKVG